MWEGLWHWQRQPQIRAQAQVSGPKIRRPSPKLFLQRLSHQMFRLLQQAASRQERNPRRKRPASPRQPNRARLPHKLSWRLPRIFPTSHRNRQPMRPLSPHRQLPRQRNRSEVVSAQQLQHQLKALASRLPPLLRRSGHERGPPRYQARRGTSQQLPGRHEAESAARPQQKTERATSMAKRIQTSPNGGPQGHSARPPLPMPRLFRSTSRRSRWRTWPRTCTSAKSSACTTS